MFGFLAGSVRIIKRAFFCDVTEIIKLGKSRIIELRDLFPLPKTLTPHRAGSNFWQLNLRNPWNFLFDIIKILKEKSLIVFAFNLLILVTQLSSPLIIHSLLSHIENSATGNSGLLEGIIYGGLLCLVAIVSALGIQHYIYHAVVLQQMITNGLNLRIYKKTLRLVKFMGNRQTVGDIINHMGADTQAVAEFPLWLNELLHGVFCVVMVSGLSFYFLDEAAIAVIITLVILIPISQYATNRFVKLDDKIMKYRDKRISLMSQILNGIRIIKCLVWEGEVRKEVGAIRAQEIATRRGIVYLEGFSFLLFAGVTTLVCIGAFTVRIWLGYELDAATVFASLALFSTLEHPLGNLAAQISGLSAAKVAAQRIGKFLGQPTPNSEKLEIMPPSAPLGIQLRNFSSAYREGEAAIVKNWNLDVNPGESVAIIGPVGCGKTNLLLSLLGETKILEGNYQFTNLLPDRRPRFAWVPQRASILNTTIRDNILWGTQSDGIDKALWLSAFDGDVAAMAEGLDTLIGEHGVNLSGGQKQRVSLARAIMQEPGIVLLDDPLSAVDCHTEDLLAKRLLFGRWKGITRIVATHRLKYLSRFDRIVYVEDGAIIAQGKFDELWKSCASFRAFYYEHQTTVNKGEDLEKELAATIEVTGGAAKKSNSSPANGKIIADEDREKGAVKFRVYLDYFKAMAGRNPLTRKWIALGLVVLATLATFSPILQNSWLSIWTNKVYAGETTGIKAFFYSLLGSDSANILTFSIISGLVLLFSFLQYLIWSLSSIEAGRVLHDIALNKTLITNIRFFDSNPIGRILNRFSQDLGSVERHISWSFQEMIISGLKTISSFILIMTVLPISLIIMLPVMYLYLKLQKDYRATARETKRLYSITKSPRFSHFKETIESLQCIRGFNKENYFLEKFYATLERNQKAFYTLALVNRWFSLRIPLLSSAISIVVIGFIIWLAQQHLLLAGTAGLLLTYTLQFWNHINWSIRCFSETESHLTAVERLTHYGKLPSEPQRLKKSTAILSSSWPHYGAIEFKKVCATYDESLPPVLRDLSFKVTHGAKIGLIGKTGAGKSSIIQVLFRFMKILDGQILIDNIDITTIPLNQLRRAIAIIPQDPTLFMGTLRRNLDRYNTHCDAKLWQILDKVSLKEAILKIPGKLEAKVEESGSNFSQGQRQLICLARALLNDVKIVVIDEATANVDVKTDRFIQNTLHQHCKDKTVLVIAHRLGTVSECDRIIELSGGKVKKIHSGYKIKAPKKDPVNIVATATSDVLI